MIIGEGWNLNQLSVSAPSSYVTAGCTNLSVHLTPHFPITQEQDPEILKLFHSHPNWEGGIHRFQEGNVSSDSYRVHFTLGCKLLQCCWMSRFDEANGTPSSAKSRDVTLRSKPDVLLKPAALWDPVHECHTGSETGGITGGVQHPLEMCFTLCQEYEQCSHLVLKELVLKETVK